MRQEVRLSGFGGQGIILAGYVLGRAAAIFGSKQAVLTQSYGPEARGGACAAELIISDDAIEYPLVTQPTLVVCMSQEAFSKYGADIAEGARLIVDTDLVEGSADLDWLSHVPATRLAKELGNRMVANVIMLGFFANVTGVVSREALEQAVRATVKPKLLDLNLQALTIGWEQAETAAGSPVGAIR